MLAIAIEMSGGPGTVYAARALTAYDELVQLLIIYIKHNLPEYRLHCITTGCIPFYKYNE